jgi:hypothetical protein
MRSASDNHIEEAFANIAIEYVYAYGGIIIRALFEIFRHHFILRLTLLFSLNRFECNTNSTSTLISTSINIGGRDDGEEGVFGTSAYPRGRFTRNIVGGVQLQHRQLLHQLKVVTHS